MRTIAWVLELLDVINHQKKEEERTIRVFITRSDFYDKLLGKAVRLKWEDDCVYGVIAPSGETGNSETQCRIYTLSEIECTDCHMHDIDSIDSIYEWKKDVDGIEFNDLQKSFIADVGRLVELVSEKFGIGLQFNTYAVLAGSFVNSRRYRIADDYIVKKTVCIPLEPYGYLAVVADVRKNIVSIGLAESVESISECSSFRVTKPFSITHDFMLNTDFYPFCDSSECFELVDRLKNSIDEGLFKGINIEDVTTVIEGTIVPFNRVKVHDEKVNVETYAELCRDALGEIESSVRVNKWYKSPSGKYYAFLGWKGLFVYLRVESVYSGSGIVLYKELIACIYNDKSKSRSYSERVVGRFRGKEKRLKLLELCMKTDMITSPTYYSEVYTCEICPSLGVTRVLDGANQVDVFLSCSPYFLPKCNMADRHIIFKKNDKCSYYMDGDFDISDSDMKLLYSTLLRVDSGMFEKGNFKYGVYTWDEGMDVVKITAKRYVIDSCHNFLDCLNLCKNKTGKKFLIVMFNGDTISGQWRVLLSGKHDYSVSRIA